MNEKLLNQIDFIVKIDEMKNVLRRNINISVNRRENDAEHSWQLAVMAMLFKEYSSEVVDYDKAVKMCLVHDLVEVYAGDTFCWDTKANESKAERERLAADKLFSSLLGGQGNEIRSLWEEFDSMSTPESRYANAMDRLQPFILNMHTEGHTWRLANTTFTQAMGRFGMIKNTLPIIWNYVEENLEIAVNKGWIKDDRK